MVTLQIGDEIECPHCGNWHRVDVTKSAGSHPYTSKMLYFFCHTAFYFAGAIGDQPKWPARRP